LEGIAHKICSLFLTLNIQYVEAHMIVKGERTNELERKNGLLLTIAEVTQ